MRKGTSLIVVSLWLFGMPALTEARAETCDGLDALGECVGLSTVKWCDGDQVLVVECPEGEICAEYPTLPGTDSPYEPGSFHCVDKDKTPCKDVPPEGQCTSGNAVVWCERGKLATRQCTSGQVCDFDADKGWMDCIREGTAGADAGPDANYSDSEQPEPEPPRAEETDAGPTGDSGQYRGESDAGADVQGPTPQVEKGEAYSADDPTGCRGAGHATAPLFWLLALLITVLVRRRRTRA